MKTKHFAKGLLFGAALVLASAAFAGEKASVKLYDDVKVNGKTLAIATVPAQIAATNPAPSSTGYSTRKEDDGSRSLTNVFFAGKKYTLNLDQQAAAPAPAVSASGTK